MRVTLSVCFRKRGRRTVCLCWGECITEREWERECIRERWRERIRVRDREKETVCVCVL